MEVNAWPDVGSQVCDDGDGALLLDFAKRGCATIVRFVQWDGGAMGIDFGGPAEKRVRVQIAH